jgi:hypothetical protein
VDIFGAGTPILRQNRQRHPNSLTKAIQFFDDAFLAIQVVEDKTLYQGTEKTIPHDSKYRVSGFP